MITRRFSPLLVLTRNGALFHDLKVVVTQCFFSALCGSSKKMSVRWTDITYL